MIIGSHDFDVKNHTYVCGILNVTPDSFSDGGKNVKLDYALKNAEKMIKDGADIIDVGGESTRPGYTAVSDEEEITRVIPVVEALKKNFDVPVSLDTYKYAVMGAGIAAGADLINDVQELTLDLTTAGLIAESDLPVCLMQNKEPIMSSVNLAIEAGVKKEKIIIDPGVGFNRTYEQNIEAIKDLDKWVKMGFPVLLGCSRKSVIGLTLNLPVEERLEGTLATTAKAVMCGAAFVRVHDVLENVRFIKMLEALK